MKRLTSLNIETCSYNTHGKLQSVHKACAEFEHRGEAPHKKIVGVKREHSNS